jgi:hypothetical protein
LLSAVAALTATDSLSAVTLLSVDFYAEALIAALPEAEDGKLRGGGMPRGNSHIHSLIGASTRRVHNVSPYNAGILRAL